MELVIAPRITRSDNQPEFFFLLLLLPVRGVLSALRCVSHTDPQCTVPACVLKDTRPA